MKYFLSNVSNLYLNNDGDNNKTNSNNILIYNPKSKFGKLKYKTRLSRLYKTNNKNNYFAKTRKLKPVISTLKLIELSTENGFFFELLLVGLGFKVTRLKSSNMLVFELHFSHKLYFNIPQNVSVRCIKKKIVLFGIDKSELVNVAEKIKALRYPNTYKGKGIKYLDEVIKLKPGKQR